MILVDQIRAMLLRLSQDEISLEEFEDWFMPAALHMHSDSPDEAIKIASLIHAMFSERDDASIDEAALKAELSGLLSAPIPGVVVALPQCEVVSTSSAASRDFTIWVNIQAGRAPSFATAATVRSAQRLIAVPLPA